ncbi:MAG: dethiobiotin synthase [Hyphomicrobium aestuarii]|nr:dethiobiotin synthase [Hyphomicrobium aestuarii]
MVLPTSRQPATLARTPRRFVVTGTDTNVGKTVVAAGLVAALDGEYWKPIQSGLGGQTDTDTVRALSGLPPDRFHTEAYRLTAPLAPLHAAIADGVTIDEARLVPPHAMRPLIIEGAGGLLVPVTQNLTMADLFARWQIPVVLVARTALGTINHTLLSIEATRARHIPIVGVVFVGDANRLSEHHIASHGAVRHLGRLPHLDPLDQATLASAFAAGLDLSAFIDEVEP